MGKNKAKDPFEEFVVLILTHGRPDNVVTYSTLRESGYTGPIVLVIDNEDKTANEYRSKYGDEVVMFDKKAMADKTDEADNFDNRKTITHARNASYEIAQKLGYKYFVQLDDDYSVFQFRIDGKGNYPKVLYKIRQSMNKVFKTLLDFYVSIPAKSLAMAQGGDYLGGSESELARTGKMKRKCMNSFICSVDRPVKFVGTMNEDVNTYTSLGAKGHLFLTVPFVSLVQKPTQSNAGGITETYLKYGTFCKASYTVIFSPSCTKIAMMHSKNKRIHHAISWKNAVPVILREEHSSCYKKAK